MNLTDLYNTFYSLVEKGDEPGIRAFLIDHINDFPEEIKEKIVFAFFTEAVVADGNAAIVKADLLQKGKKILEELSVAENALNDQIKVSTLKDTI